MDTLYQSYRARVAAIAVAAIVIVVFILSFAAQPLRKTPADQIALSYGGGPFEGAQFQKIVQPGSGLHFNGWFDKWYEYPVTQRNYIVSKNEDEGDRGHADSITAPTKDKVQVEYEIAAYFKLNTNIIRNFHETLGLKYHAWTEAGWDQLLNDNFRQQLENALQLSSRQFTVDELISDPASLQKIQDDIASSLKDQVNSALGAPYFCGPTFKNGTPDCPDFKIVLKKPTFPVEITDAYRNQKASAAGIITAQNNAQQKVEEAKGVQAQQEALKGSVTPEYIALLQAQAMQACASNPNCTLVVTPSGGNINVNTGK